MPAVWHQPTVPCTCHKPGATACTHCAACAALGRSDIQQLEARWSSRWQEQSAATAELKSNVEAGGKEVNSRLDGIVAELAAQKQRLEVVERAQVSPGRLR